MKDMIEELQSIATFLAHDPLTVREVVERLGTVIEDYGSNVLVTPNSPLFREANVVRQVDRTTFDPIDVPDHVILKPVGPLPVGANERAQVISRISYRFSPPGRSTRIVLPTSALRSTSPIGALGVTSTYSASAAPLLSPTSR